MLACALSSTWLEVASVAVALPPPASHLELCGAAAQARSPATDGTNLHCGSDRVTVTQQQCGPKTLQGLSVGHRRPPQMTGGHTGQSGRLARHLWQVTGSLTFFASAPGP